MRTNVSTSAFPVKADGAEDTDALGDCMIQKEIEDFSPSGVECPTCGDEFESSKGVKAHHQQHDRPYWDAVVREECGVSPQQFLNEKYVEDGLSSNELGDLIGCSRSTVLRLLRRYGIDVRKSNQEKPPWFGTDTQGYESIKHNSKHGKHEFRIHRLMAVAKYGFEKACENDVHHKSEVEWDNRMENIEIMTHSEHRRHHAIDRHSSDE